jgi:hypothetical protein
MFPREIIYMSTVKDLRIMAKGQGLKGYSSMTKPQLEEFISKASVAMGNPIAKEEVKEHVAEASTPAATEKAKRAKSQWNEFLSEHRVKNNISLKDAMKAKDEYASWKAAKN